MTETLGGTLKKIRESKHLSLEEVSERTRIPKKIISTIEEDRLNEIQSVFYAKSFVKSYSRFLGASEEKVVQGYLSAGPKKDTPRLALKSDNIAGEWFAKRKKYIGGALLIIFGAYALIFGLVHTGKMIKKASIRHRERVAQKKEEKKTQEAVKVVSPQPVPEVKNEIKNEGVELMIEARYNTWIQVTGDGALLFRGALKKGTKDVWRAKKEIKLELGNAGGVILVLNGKDLGSLGRKGQKKTIIVTEKGIESKPF